MDPSQAANEAYELIKKAESKKGKGFFGFLSGGNSTDEVCEAYEKAANKFKIAKMPENAADVQIKLAKLQADNKVYHEATKAYQSAAQLLAGIDVDKAIDCYSKAIEIKANSGGMNQAAKMLGDVGDLYETKKGDLDAALKHYRQGAEYLDQENSSKSQANTAWLKVANLSAQLGNYAEAAKIFEKSGNYCANSNLLKYGAKDHFFKAVICYGLVNIENGKAQQTQFNAQFPMYETSRESQLLNKLFAALEDNKVQDYEAAVKEYDSLSKLDGWTVSMLLKLKGNLADEEDIC